MILTSQLANIRNLPLPSRSGVWLSGSCYVLQPPACREPFSPPPSLPCTEQAHCAG